MSFLICTQYTNTYGCISPVSKDLHNFTKILYTATEEYLLLIPVSFVAYVFTLTFARACLLNKLICDHSLLWSPLSKGE